MSEKYCYLLSSLGTTLKDVLTKKKAVLGERSSLFSKHGGSATIFPGFPKLWKWIT